MDKYIENLVSICVSSANIKNKLVLNEGKIKYKVNPQFHVMLIQPAGSGKSSSIINVENTHECSGFTRAGLMGTISKDGEFIEGDIIKTAGKCLWIDEFHNLSIDARNVLLKMLEEQQASRSLGYKVKSPIKHNRFKSKGYEYKVKDGRIEVKSRFSCLATGLFAPSRTLNDRAFVSRFTVLKSKNELKDIYNLSRGKVICDIVNYNIDELPEFEDYLKFTYNHEAVVEMLPKPFLDTLSDDKNIGFVSRNIGHMARYYSIRKVINLLEKNERKKHEKSGKKVLKRGVLAKKNENEILKETLKLIPISLYNCVSQTLTNSEYKILNFYQKGFKQKEIAVELNVSQAYVSKIVQKLDKKGLTTQIEEIKNEI